MGAGCYYTNKETGTKSFWIDLDSFMNEDENFNDFWSGYFKTILNELGYIEIDNNKFINGLYTLYLEFTYYGNGLIFRLEPHEDDTKIYNLAMANFDKNYHHLARVLIKDNFKLRIASSSYTSMEYTV